MSSIRTSCYIHIPWYHPFSLFSSFFFLNLFFFVNFEFITNPVTLLSNNSFTIILSLLSFCFNPILTITSLNIFFFFSFLELLVPPVRQLSAYVVISITLLIKTSNLLLEDHCFGPPFSILLSYLIFLISTMIDDMSKTTISEILYLLYCYLSIFFSSSLLGFLLLSLLLCFSLFSYSYFLNFIFSLVLLLLSLSSFLHFLSLFIISSHTFLILLPPSLLFFCFL